MCDLKQQVVMCNTYGISSFLFMFLARDSLLLEISFGFLGETFSRDTIVSLI